jgi:hypothetical protein
MALMEPVYKNFFTVQIKLPSALGYDDAGTNLFLEEITKVGGLNTHKVEQAVTQGYKFSQRSFAQGKPNETTVDITLDFEVNLDYTNDNRPSNFLIKTIRKWTDLVYDPLTGRSGLKKDYVADQMVVTMQDRAGTPYWQWVFYNVFPTTGIGDPGLDYNTTDLLKVSGWTLRADSWSETII